MTDKPEPTFHEACAALDASVQELKRVLLEEWENSLLANRLGIFLFFYTYLNILLLAYILGWI